MSAFRRDSPARRTFTDTIVCRFLILTFSYFFQEDSERGKKDVRARRTIQRAKKTELNFFYLWICTEINNITFKNFTCFSRQFSFYSLFLFMISTKIKKIIMCSSYKHTVRKKTELYTAIYIVSCKIIEYALRDVISNIQS